MGTIERRVDTALDITVFSAVGKVGKSEYEKTITAFYEIGPVTKYVLWDLSQCILDHLESADVYSLAQTPRHVMSTRDGGKTAIVAPTDLAFGLARMFEFTAGKEDLPFDTATFRTVEDAMEWLQEE